MQLGPKQPLGLPLLLSNISILPLINKLKQFVYRMSYRWFKFILLTMKHNIASDMIVIFSLFRFKFCFHYNSWISPYVLLLERWIFH
jgi:hypothetical protein